MPTGADVPADRAPRRAAVAIVLILLGATAAGFVYTQRQKLARGTISQPHATRFFSPVCECERATATVRFRLARPLVVIVQILTEDGRLVRTLVNRHRFDAGPVRLEWDGRTDAGETAPDGRYRVAILTGDDALVFPQRVALDTRPPRAEMVRAVSRNALEGEPVVAVVTYALSERGYPILYVDGVEALRGRQGERGKIGWDGTIGGRPVAPGAHRLSVAGLDLAGNLGLPSAPRIVFISP